MLNRFILLLTKTEVISELTTCKWLDQACKNIGKEYWEDLRQEFLLAVLEMPDIKIQAVRELRFWGVRVLENLFKPALISGTYYPKPLARLFNANNYKEIPFYERSRPGAPENDAHTILKAVMNMPLEDEYDTEFDSAMEKKEHLLNQLPIYERRMYKLHEDGMSKRAIAEHTDIHRTEVTKRVRIVKKLIKESCKYK